jgi:hypothetical protein
VLAAWPAAAATPLAAREPLGHLAQRLRRMPPLARLEHAIVIAIEALEHHLAKRRARRHALHADPDLRTRRRPANWIRLSRSSANQQSNEQNCELHVLLTLAACER